MSEEQQAPASDTAGLGATSPDMGVDSADDDSSDVNWGGMADELIADDNAVEGDEQVVDVHAYLPGIAGVERVLGVDERAHAARLLGFGDDVEDEGRLAVGFGPEDFDDAAAGHAVDAEGHVEGERAGGDEGDLGEGAFAAEAHDGAFAEFLLDLREDGGQGGGQVLELARELLPGTIGAELQEWEQQEVEA